MKKPLLFCAIAVFSLSLMAQISKAQEKIQGPWMWMIAACQPGQGGQACTDVDSLKEVSKSKVTEEMVAKNGIDKKIAKIEIDGRRWVEGKIAPTGGNNIQDMINANKGKWGGGWSGVAADINDHSAYAVINAVAPKAQKGITTRVGSDDSVKVWVNGEEVHRNAVNRGAADFQDTFSIDLKRGNDKEEKNEKSFTTQRYLLICHFCSNAYSQRPEKN
ncbi:MAG: hypothetical protein ACE5PV_05040 [Candidatus Poribacteria bacterium]